MYLVNIHSHKLQEFLEEQVPPYAILSHRWGPQELSFEEVSEGRIDQSKAGYQKFLSSCQIAGQYEIDYVWNDTCCIDKKSSAELSEAINSMFRWYEKAQFCLAYLEDVTVGDDFEQSFRNSLWFTRSWTLQELLAPKTLVFYDSNWECAGDKAVNLSLISDITSIPEDAIAGKRTMVSYTVAQRVSWASGRQATRKEDVAYSLMGILDVSMPLLYGEGGKAFRRLQEELLRHAHSLSFLYWGAKHAGGELLADSPADFMPVERYKNMDGSTTTTSFVLNNLALEVEATLVRYSWGVWGVVISRLSLFGQNHIHPPGSGNVKNSGADDDYILLLVKKHPKLNAFQRVGIAKYKVHKISKIWFIKNKILILRQQHSGLHEPHRMKGRQILFGYRIEIGPPLSVTPCDRDSEFHPKTTEGQCHYELTSDCLTCEFDSPLFGCVARIKCTGPGPSNFQIDLSFDIDFKPCVLIKKDDIMISDYNKLGSSSLWDLSYQSQKDGGVSHSGWGLERRRRMLCMEISGSPETPAYFLRHESDTNISFMIPAEVATSIDPIWASFVYPKANADHPPFWTFKLTSGEPQTSPGWDGNLSGIFDNLGDSTPSPSPGKEASGFPPKPQEP